MTEFCNAEIVRGGAPGELLIEECGKPATVALDGEPRRCAECFERTRILPGEVTAVMFGHLRDAIAELAKPQTRADQLRLIRAIDVAAANMRNSAEGKIRRSKHGA